MPRYLLPILFDGFGLGAKPGGAFDQQQRPLPANAIGKRSMELFLTKSPREIVVRRRALNMPTDDVPDKDTGGANVTPGLGALL